MAEKKSGGSKKLLWIMVVLVLLSTIGAAAAIYMVLGQRDGQGADGEDSKPLVRETPVFTRIDPFTVNLNDDRYGSRLLYTGITLRVGNEESKSIIEEHMPQVRSRLLILLSGGKRGYLGRGQGTAGAGNYQPP